jgi:hypothetical protein
MTRRHLEPGHGSAAQGERRELRVGWLLLAIAVSGRSGLSPLQLQRSLFLVAQKRGEQVGPGFYEFEANGSGPSSADLYGDLDALVSSDHLLKEWVPDSSCSAFHLSASGSARAEAFRRKAKRDALSGLEDAVAWVKEQSYLDRIHKTSTVRVIG